MRMNPSCRPSLEVINEVGEINPLINENNREPRDELLPKTHFEQTLNLRLELSQRWPRALTELHASSLACGQAALTPDQPRLHSIKLRHVVGDLLANEIPNGNRILHRRHSVDAEQVRTRENRRVRDSISQRVRLLNSFSRLQSVQDGQTTPSLENALQKLARVAQRTKKGAVGDKAPESCSERFELTAERLATATPQGLNCGHLFLCGFYKSDAPPVILRIAVDLGRRRAHASVDIVKLIVGG